MNTLLRHPSAPSTPALGRALRTLTAIGLLLGLTAHVSAQAPPEPAPPETSPPTEQPPIEKPVAKAPAPLPQVPVVLPSDGPIPKPLSQPEQASPLPPRSVDATPVVSPGAIAEPPLPEAMTPDSARTRAGVADEAAAKRIAAKLTPTRFQGLEPGRSKSAEVIEQLGEPLQETKGDGEETIWSYQLGPFPRVEVTIVNDVVDAIFVKVKDLPTAATVAEQLQVDRHRGAIVLSRTGEPLGVVYPEGGVMLSLRPRQDEGHGVFSIVLEPINAELFVTRARNTNAAQCTQRISDLNVALSMAPQHVEALGLKARIYASIGETRKALKLAQAASAVGSEHAADWQLLTARLEAELGNMSESSAILERLLAANPPDILRAESLMLKGDLLAMQGKHEDALPHHKQAIALVKEYMNSEILEVRHGALRVLANGHLAIANDISWGNWKRKPEVVPMWVNTGHKYADMLIAMENVEPILAQRVQRLTLSAYAGFAEAVDPKRVCEEAVRNAETLLESAEDPLHRQRIEWELAETMYHAMVAERRRGAFDSAIEYAKISSPLFTKTQQQRELTPRETYMVGQLHFLAGSCLAVEANRHDAAVKWYKRGAMALLEPFPPAVIGDGAELGDQLVSMGVSFWKTGDKEQAISLTKRGVQVLQKAADQAQEPAMLKSLHVAYGNLAAMLRAAGRADEAKQWSQRLSQLPPATSR